MSAAIATGPAPVGLGERVGRFLLRRAPLLLILGMCVYLALASPFFFTLPNLTSSLVQAAPVAIVAMGLAIVVIGGGDDVVTGGIDLSLPATAALGTVIMSDQLTNRGASFIQALLVAVAAALVVGIVNAVLVGLVGLSSILATLAMYAAVVGITRVISGNKRIDVVDPTVILIRDARIGGIPLSVLIMLAIAAVLVFLVRRTPFGLRLQAVGGNRDAAQAAGLRTRAYVMSTFVLAALVGGLAAALLVARGSGSSPGIDERLMVDMVLATFLGAAFSARATVTVFGAVLGAVFVSLMANGLILTRVDNAWIDGWKGLLILVVVSAAALRREERTT